MTGGTCALKWQWITKCHFFSSYTFFCTLRTHYASTLDFQFIFSLNYVRVFQTLLSLLSPLPRVTDWSSRLGKAVIDRQALMYWSSVVGGRRAFLATAADAAPVPPCVPPAAHLAWITNEPHYRTDDAVSFNNTENIFADSLRILRLVEGL